MAAALVPDTVLLVPGAGGAADPGRGLREAAEEAVGEALTAAGALPTRLVVVAPGRDDRRLDPPHRASLGGVGIPDALLRWPVPGPAGAPVPGTPAAVGLHLVARHRAADDVAVVEVGPGADGRSPAARGAALVDGGPTVLVVVGSGSARHGPDAPLADDPRAPAYDEALLADLADAGRPARDRLAALDPHLAAALAVTGLGPWQVLVGAAGGAEVAGRLLARQTLAGATHAVLTWRVAR